MSLIPKKGTVYVVDDDEAVRDSLQWLLEGKDYRVKCFDSSESFLSRFDPREVACLIADIRLSLTPETVTPTVSLDVGSGNPALDQLALNMLDRAARITPVPLTLHHKTRAVVIRVEFAADNEQSERTQGGGGDNSAR